MDSPLDTVVRLLRAGIAVLRSMGEVAKPPGVSIERSNVVLSRTTWLNAFGP